MLATVTMPIDLQIYIFDALSALVVIVSLIVGVQWGFIILRKAQRWARSSFSDRSPRNSDLDWHDAKQAKRKRINDWYLNN